MPFQHVKTKHCKGDQSELFWCVRSVWSCIFGLDTWPKWTKTRGVMAPTPVNNPCVLLKGLKQCVKLMLLLYTLDSLLALKSSKKARWRGKGHLTRRKPHFKSLESFSKVLAVFYLLSISRESQNVLESQVCWGLPKMLRSTNYQSIPCFCQDVTRTWQLRCFGVYSPR